MLGSAFNLKSRASYLGRAFDDRNDTDLGFFEFKGNPCFWIFLPFEVSTIEASVEPNRRGFIQPHFTGEFQGGMALRRGGVVLE